MASAVGGRAPHMAARLLALLLFLTYSYFVSPPSWNESSRFGLVRSLVERRRLDIDPYQHETGDKAYRQGHYYSDKAPGASFLAAPAYAAYFEFRRLAKASVPASVPAAGRPEEGDPQFLVNAAYRRALYLCSLFTSALAGALLGGLFFAFLGRRFGVPDRDALLAAVTLGLGSLVLPYATMFYGHVLAALLLFAAFALLAGPGQDRGSGLLAGAGALAGLAVLTELPAAPVAVLLAAHAAWRARPRRRALWFLVGSAGPLLLLLAYQYAAFGGPLRPGYALVTRPEFAAGMGQGVMGVGLPRPAVLFAELFGRARGLLYLSPVLVLGFVGLGRRLARSRDDAVARLDTLVAAAVVLYFLLMNAGYYMWYGGSALGPRHVIPALPFLCLGVPFAFRGARRRLLGALLTVSVMNQLAATAVDPAAPLVRDVLRDHVYRLLLAGDVALPGGRSNLGALVGLPGVASLLPLLALWALALPILIPLLSAKSDRPIIADADRGGAGRPAQGADTDA
jgi:hypothetical protein